MTTLWLLAQDGGPTGEEAAAAAGGMVAVLLMLVCYLVVLAGMGALCFWGVFKKAGQPPAMSMVPIANAYFLLKVAGKPGWWLILLLIPLVSLFAFVFVCLEIARRFGKDTGYAIGLILLGIVFFPLLGFGDAKYNPNPTTPSAV